MLSPLSVLEVNLSFFVFVISPFCICTVLLFMYINLEVVLAHSLLYPDNLAF